MAKSTPVLPEDVTILKEMVRHRDEEIGYLREQVRSLKHHLLGPKSEVLGKPEDDAQTNLFELDEVDLKEAKQEHVDDQPDGSAKPPRRPRGRRKLPKFLAREEIIHDLPESEKRCACGEEKACIGRLTTEVLERIPVQLTVTVHHHLKYACQNADCDTALAGKAGTVCIVEAPARMIPQSMAGHSLLAHVVSGKFVDGLPLYRIEQQMKREGLLLPRHTMSRWMQQLAERITPLWEALLEKIKTYPYGAGR